MEMNRTTRLLWIALAFGSLSPILAGLIKPAHYSFYMFFPATPDSSGERIRLVLADALLVSGFAIALLASFALAARGLKRRNFAHLAWPVLVLANPFQQPIFLESLDSSINDRWREKAEHLSIVGKSPSEIREIFGNPSYQWSEEPKATDREGRITWQGEPYTGWDYHVLPFYWFGSKFQVFFVNGKVKGFEANDD